MLWFRKKTKKQPKIREDSPEVIAARNYLDKTHSALTGRDSAIGSLCGNAPFNYLESSKNGEYTRYHFCQGSDERIIYIVLCDEEREKIIQLFKEKTANYSEEFIYKDSLKGMFIGDNVQHRFFSARRLIFMSDDGIINFPTILQEGDMD